MFKKFKKTPTALDSEINRVLVKLSRIDDVDSEKYRQLLDRLSTLHKMKAETKPSGVSSDAALAAATNLVGIMLIINHERLHVISRSAMGLVKRI